MRYLNLSIGAVLLLPLSVFSQMGARMPPIDYDEGAFRNPADWWWTVLIIVNFFIAPYLITRKGVDSDGGGYIKWFLALFIAYFISLLLIPLLANKNDYIFWTIAIQLGVTCYGFINNKNTEVKNYIPPAALTHKKEQLEPKNFNESSVTINQPRIKGKIWSVVGGKIYNKLTNKLYPYSILKSGLALRVISSNLDPYIGMVNISSVDLIKFNKGMAIVECPNCGMSNEVLQADELLISCSMCRFSWKQDLKIRD
jgi:hypothetical protein